MDGGWQGSHRSDRGDVEDASLPLPDHLLVNWLCNGKQTVDVSVDHFVPGAVRRGGEVVAAVYCSVIHKDIDATPLFDEFPCYALHTNTVCYRNFGVESTATVSFDLLIHFKGEIVTGVVAKRHIRAFSSKHLADGCTNTTRSPADERTLSFKQQAHYVCVSSKPASRSGILARKQNGISSVWGGLCYQGLVFTPGD